MLLRGTDVRCASALAGGQYRDIGELSSRVHLSMLIL